MKEKQALDKVIEKIREQALKAAAIKKITPPKPEVVRPVLTP